MHTTARHTAATLALWTVLGGGPALAATAGQPHYIGPVAGNPERDTYGYVVTAAVGSVLCVVGRQQYFGPVTGDAERDDYGYVTALVYGTSCPLRTASSK